MLSIHEVNKISAKIYGARDGRNLELTIKKLEKGRQGGYIENNNKSNFS